MATVALSCLSLLWLAPTPDTGCFLWRPCGKEPRRDLVYLFPKFRRILLLLFFKSFPHFVQDSQIDHIISKHWPSNASYLVKIQAKGEISLFFHTTQIIEQAKLTQVVLSSRMTRFNAGSAMTLGGLILSLTLNLFVCPGLLGNGLVQGVDPDSVTGPQIMLQRGDKFPANVTLK